MDIKLDKNTGDFFKDERGMPVDITGLEELLQRAYIAVAVPMGTLPAAGSFGGDRILVEKGLETDRGQEGFLAMAENALSAEGFRREGLKVLSAELYEDAQRGRITVSSRLGEGSFEVDI